VKANWVGNKREELKRPAHANVAAHQPTHALIFHLLQIVRRIKDSAEVTSSPLCQSPACKYSKPRDAAHTWLYVFGQIFHTLRN